MKNNEYIYRLVDYNGRILIPKHVREKVNINYGDIVKLTEENGKLIVQKVNLTKKHIDDSKYVNGSIEAYLIKSK